MWDDDNTMREEGKAMATIQLPVLVCRNPKCGHEWVPRVAAPKVCPWCRTALAPKAGRSAAHPKA